MGRAGVSKWLNEIRLKSYWFQLQVVKNIIKNVKPCEHTQETAGKKKIAYCFLSKGLTFMYVLQVYWRKEELDIPSDIQTSRP